MPNPVSAKRILGGDFMKFKHSYARKLVVAPLILAILILGVAVALPAAEEVDAVTESVLIVSPVRATVGSLVTVTGLGFAPNSNVTLELGNMLAQEASFVDVTPANPTPGSPSPYTTTSASGVVPSRFTVPERLGDNSTVIPGYYTIRMTDLAGNSASTAVIDAGPFGFMSYFHVVATIELSASQGEAGETITVTGEGFSASKEITIHLTGQYVIPQAYIPTLAKWYERAPGFLYPEDPGAGATDTPPADNMTPVTVTTDENGRLPDNTNFTVPGISAGLYEVSALDTGVPMVTVLVPQQAWSVPAKADLNVGPPYVTLSPDSGIIGSTVEVSGTGFAADETVEIFFQVNEYPVPDLSMKPEDSATLQSGWFAVTPPTNIAGSVPKTDSNGDFTGDNAVRITVLNTMGPKTKIRVAVGDESTEVVFGIAPSIEVTPDTGRGTAMVTGAGFPGTPDQAGLKVAKVVTILVSMAPVPTNPSIVLTSTSGGVIATIGLPSDMPAMAHAVIALSGELSATASFTLIDPLGPVGPEGPEGPAGPEGEDAPIALPIVALILAVIAIAAVAGVFVLRPRS